MALPALYSEWRERQGPTGTRPGGVMGESSATPRRRKGIATNLYDVCERLTQAVYEAEGLKRAVPASVEEAEAPEQGESKQA